MARLPLLLLPFLLFHCGTSPEDKLAQANAALEAADLETAGRLFQNILQQNPHQVEAIEGMVTVTRPSPASDEHKHWCRELLKYRPWDRHANLIIGLTLAQEGQLDDAMNRLILAYMDSVFTLEREQAKEAIARVRILAPDSATEETP